MRSRRLPRRLIAVMVGTRSPTGTRSYGSEGEVWRRERDSNPWYGFPYTRFPSVLLKPLGHLSVRWHPSLPAGAGPRQGEVDVGCRWSVPLDTESLDRGQEVERR